MVKCTLIFLLLAMRALLVPIELLDANAQTGDGIRYGIDNHAIDSAGENLTKPEAKQGVARAIAYRSIRD